MATMYYDKDADLGLIQGKKVAVIGYGSQGHAHALNLKDSGVSVKVGLPADEPVAAQGAGCRPRGGRRRRRVEVGRRHHGAGSGHDRGEALQGSDRAEPGRRQRCCCSRTGSTSGSATIAPRPDVDVAMVAPKAPGHRVRELYSEGAGTPALIAVHQDATGHGEGPDAVLCEGDWRHAGRRHRDDICRGDRD